MKSCWSVGFKKLSIGGKQIAASLSRLPDTFFCSFLQPFERLSRPYQKHPVPHLWYSAEFIQSRKGLFFESRSSAECLRVWAVSDITVVLICIPPRLIRHAKCRSPGKGQIMLQWEQGWCTVARGVATRQDQEGLKHTFCRKSAKKHQRQQTHSLS